MIFSVLAIYQKWSRCLQQNAIIDRHGNGYPRYWWKWWWWEPYSSTWETLWYYKRKCQYRWVFKISPSRISTFDSWSMPLIWCNPPSLLHGPKICIYWSRNKLHHSSTFEENVPNNRVDHHHQSFVQSFEDFPSTCHWWWGIEFERFRSVDHWESTCLDKKPNLIVALCNSLFASPPKTWKEMGRAFHEH